MKKFTFKGVLDGFRSSVSQGSSGAGGSGSKSYEQEISENLKPEHFNVTKTFCHGFPYQPTALSYDPILRLLAIGTKNGGLRILGRPGVDVHVRHDPDCGAVLHLQFVWNEGYLISSTADDSLHLWNFRATKKPQVVQSLKFQRERITCLQLPFQSKWLCVGTERGNVHVVNTDTFQLSGYIINWNKAIELSRKTHPGPVLFLHENPTDPSKLLIGFETGALVLWDLRNKIAELRFQGPEPLRSVSWHSDGKQFMSSHTDGSLVTWNLRQSPKPVSITWPHSRNSKDGKPEPCKTIQKVEWKSSKTGENFVIFSGGLTASLAGRTPSLTVIHGKTTTVLEMEHSVLDFIVLCESQWESELQDPYAVVVLLQQDLIVIDLLTPGYPCIENPYPMDIHESPVTCCIYLADCPGDLIPAFYSVGSKTQKKSGFSEKEWPINGGQWGSTSCSYAEIIITGHADGSLKFWDASSTNLQSLYKLKSSKPFERPKKSRSTETMDSDDPFAVQHIALCPESRYLAVAGASCYVVLFKFKKHEHSSETQVLEIPIIYEVEDEFGGIAGAGGGGLGFDFAKVGDSSNSGSVTTGSTGLSQSNFFCPVRVKPGNQKKSPGYQAELVCITPWVDGEPPGAISTVAVNSSYGLMAYGNEAGLVIVDIFQKICLLNMGTPDLYGTADPYQRAPKSPKRPDIAEERSPTDQVDNLVVHLTPNNTPVDDIASSSSSTSSRASSPDGDVTLENEIPIGGSVSEIEDETKTTALEFPAAPIPKCKSTTPTQGYNPPNPPTGKSSGGGRKTWSHVKVLIKKSLGEKKAAAAAAAQQQQFLSPSNIPSICANSESGASISPSSSEDVSIGPETGGGVDVRDKTERPTDLPIPPPRGRKKGTASAAPVVPIPQPEKHKKSKKSKCTDLRGSGPGSGGADGSSIGGLIKKMHKLDSTFSRSRSSSMSSLDNISSEAIQCLAFIDCMSRKNEYSIWPTLWVGTSLGSIFITSITLPPAGDARRTDRVLVSPSGTIFRLKGSILAMSFLDSNGILIPGSNEPWKDEGREQRARTPTKSLSVGQSPTQSLDSGGGSSDRQFAILVSEKQSRVVALPSQTCLYKQQLSETHFVVKANVTTVKDSVCLVCYMSNGHLSVYSLPSLKILLDVEFVPLSDLSFQRTRRSGIVDPMLSIWGQQLFVNEDANQIAKTFCLSSYGHGMYLSSPSEMQKFSISAEFSQIIDSMLGDLYLEIEMPERPKESFLTGLFGGGVKNLDREELFGESSGKGAKSVAKVIPGPGTFDQNLQIKAGTVAGEVAKTRMMMVERGDKLGQLEDRTARMMSDAENFSSAAHQLMLKYKDKKWYQL